MKTINVQELEAALAIVKPGLSNKDIIEQTTSFAFMGDRVVTYNDEISISHPVPGMELNGAVEATELYSFLGKIKKKEVNLEVTKNELLITSGRTQAGLRLESEIKLPLEELGKISKWKKLPESFSKNLQFAAMACGNDMSRALLTCVHVAPETFTGSDGYSILRIKSDEETPLTDVLIPATISNEIAKMEPTHLTTTDGWIHFKNTANTIFSCRVFSDTYPDVSPHMKVKGQEIPLPVNIEDMVDKAMVFAKRAHFLDEELLLKVSSGKMTVESKSATGSWFSDSAKIKYDGEERDISIVPQLLKKMIKNDKFIVSSSQLKFSGEGWEYTTQLRNVK